MMFHIGEAPAHGREYNNGLRDDFPAGCPAGLKPKDLLQRLLELHVQYFFFKFNSNSEAMLTAFNRLLKHLGQVSIRDRIYIEGFFVFLNRSPNLNLQAWL